ncbi:MAG: type II toxin-antitoxin system HicB family antitoxin [Candidatus Sericytochromatia bacterium]|nr:type II toxin-antitoxin system HicB family antitoxin [Candidatus Tanganyikabacteria bacterium]
MKYVIIIEQAAPDSFCVHSPDIDCCFSTGNSVEDAVKGFKQAVRRYLKDLRARGEEPPQPVTMVDTIEVA